MQRHGRIEIGFGGTHTDGDRQSLDDLGRIGA